MIPCNSTFVIVSISVEVFVQLVAFFASDEAVPGPLVPRSNPGFPTEGSGPARINPLEENTWAPLDAHNGEMKN